MTNAEAIETLRANYPDACFEQLRCAVDMAINALTKEAWKEEHPVSPLLQKLATNLQSSKQDADDTISRQNAIKAIRDTYRVLYPIDMISKADAADVLNDLPCVNPSRPNWIPCSERLPKYEEEVIVSVRDDSGDTTLDYSSCGWYACAGDFWVVDNEPNYYVIAWMPLPEPYAERKTNE